MATNLKRYAMCLVSLAAWATLEAQERFHAKGPSSPVSAAISGRPIWPRPAVQQAAPRDTQLFTNNDGAAFIEAQRDRAG